MGAGLLGGTMIEEFFEDAGDALEDVQTVGDVASAFSGRKPSAGERLWGFLKFVLCAGFLIAAFETHAFGMHWPWEKEPEPEMIYNPSYGSDYSSSSYGSNDDCCRYYKEENFR